MEPARETQSHVIAEPTTFRQAMMGAEFSLLTAEGDAMHPILSDDFLIAAFTQHRSTFEELRQMIAQDAGLRRVGADWTDPRELAKIGVSPERIAEYRRLFAEIGCPEGFAVYPARPGIYFFSGLQGMSMAGSSKGYCYLENPPAGIVTNTAAGPAVPTKGDWEIFRPIEGHWYIYLERH